MFQPWDFPENITPSVHRCWLVPHYLPDFFTSNNSADKEASCTTGHPIGLIYKDVNKSRKPPYCAYIQGLCFTVNGNIQELGSRVQADADEEDPGGQANAARPAAVDYYKSNCLKNNYFQDLIQSTLKF